MELVEAVGLLCIVVTLFMFMTGISPCLRMYRTGSVRNVPFILFLLSVISCSGMVHHGVLIQDNIILFINVVGFILNFIYMMVYIMVVQSKSGSLSGVFAGILYLCGLYYYCFNVIGDPAKYAHTIGSSASSITTFLILLGCIEVALNFRNKNSDGMDEIMWIGSLLCGLCWLSYGLLVNDAAIYAPNIPSLIISTSKMYIFTKYPKSDVSKKYPKAEEVPINYRKEELVSKKKE